MTVACLAALGCCSLWRMGQDRMEKMDGVLGGDSWPSALQWNGPPPVIKSESQHRRVTCHDI